jgi:hypothetical protein
MPRSRVYLRERSEVLPLLLRTDPRNVVRFASATEQSFEMMMHICAALNLGSRFPTKLLS